MRRTRGGGLYVVLFARSRTVFQAMTSSFLILWNLAILYLVKKLSNFVDVRRSISKPLVFYFVCVSRIYSTITISNGPHLRSIRKYLGLQKPRLSYTKTLNYK